MRRVGYLFDQVAAWDNLLSATYRAARGKKRRLPVARFLFHLEAELLQLEKELWQGTWTPGRFTCFSITDPKPRRISAAPFRDRVVHQAIMHVLDPYFERVWIHQSYACRVGKGTHAAIRQSQQWARRFPYVLKGDVEHFFETADHGVIKSQMRRLFKDRRLLDLLDRIIDTTDDGRGLPIGNLTSQYFANHLLSSLDHFVKQRLRATAYLRYMDDWLIFGSSKGELHRCRAQIRAFLRQVLRLKLKECGTWLSPVHEGIPFLGFRIFPGTIRLQGSRWRRTRKKLLANERAYLQGRIPITDLAATANSIVGHLRHADTLQLRRKLFAESRVMG